MRSENTSSSDRGKRRRGTADEIGAVLAALIANAVVTVAKMVVAAISGSAALLAEGVHSAADTGNQALLLVGNARMRKNPDATHPFGYGQELYFWGLIVAMVLFGLGGGVSIWDGLSALWSGEYSLHDPMWSYIVLGVAFVAESVSLGYSIYKLRQRHPKQGMISALRESKDPRLFIPVMEDIAAELGIFIAFGGIALAHGLELPVLDPVASIIIGLVLASVACFLAWQSRDLLIGERMDAAALREIEDTIAREPQIERVLRVMTMHLAPDEILATIEVQLASDFDGDGRTLAEWLNEIERRIYECDPRISRIFIEPEPREPAGLTPPL